MAHLLPPSSETLFPNWMWRPAKMPRLARPMTTLLSGSMSFTDFISSAGSFPSLPTRRATFLYISRARNDILPSSSSSGPRLRASDGGAGGRLRREVLVPRALQCCTREVLPGAGRAARRAAELGFWAFCRVWKMGHCICRFVPHEIRSVNIFNFLYVF